MSDFRSFKIQLEVPIAAAPGRVWGALVNETHKWWPSSMLANQDAHRMVIEPKLGGRWYENWGRDSGLVWFRVNGIRPGSWLELTGHLSAEFGGPGTTLVRLLLKADGNGTRLTLVDNSFGALDEKLESRAREGWELLTSALRLHVESRKPKKPKSRK